MYSSEVVQFGARWLVVHVAGLVGATYVGSMMQWVGTRQAGVQ